MRKNCGPAVQNCIQKIMEIDYNILDISDYNRKYIKRLLPHLTYYFDIYLQALEFFSTLKPASLFVDYGGGHGFLSMLLSALNYRVIYCDINPLSVKTVILLKEKTNLGPEFFVEGDSKTLEEFCKVRHLTPDYLIATDLIEHVYNLNLMLEQITNINPQIEMVYTTGSNPANWLKCRKLHKFMKADEILYLQKRKNYLIEKLGLTDNNTVDSIAGLTRGKTFADISKIVTNYQETGYLPALPTNRYNTCDPETGNWSERILSFAQYRKIAAKSKLRLQFQSGYYNTQRNNIFIRSLFKILNLSLKKLGGGSFLFAPYILLKFYREK
jgi:SAM-dependent methyltransferase